MVPCPAPGAPARPLSPVPAPASVRAACRWAAWVGAPLLSALNSDSTMPVTSQDLGTKVQGGDRQTVRRQRCCCYAAILAPSLCTTGRRQWYALPPASQPTSRNCTSTKFFVLFKSTSPLRRGGDLDGTPRPLFRTHAATLAAMAGEADLATFLPAPLPPPRPSPSPPAPPASFHLPAIPKPTPAPFLSSRASSTLCDIDIFSAEFLQSI
jgi:hypothetical protein